ncbi:MAG TPA: hypothetical protein VIB79_20125 [Candidatus Binatia bacterium]|jgi:hypothetical protein
MHGKKINFAILGTLLLLALTAVHAAETPDARVKMTGKALAAGVGYSWGSGVLTYQGKDYPFSVSGLSAGNIGASSVELSGDVFNLKKVEDFNGNYTSAGAEATVAGGGTAMAMKNQNGVVMHVSGATKGLAFKLGVDGMKVQLKK